MALEEPERRAAPKRAGRESEPSSFAARTVPNDALLRIAAFFALFLVFVGFPCLAIIITLGGTFAESHRNGDKAYHKGDYKEAMRWYRTAADEGDAIAQGNSDGSSKPARACRRTTKKPCAGIVCLWTMEITKRAA